MPERVRTARRKPWFKSKKVWGVIGATLIGLFAPQLGIAWTQTLSVMLALGTGVVVEGVIDAASAYGDAAKDAGGER
jgi:hypothetical protein